MRGEREVRVGGREEEARGGKGGAAETRHTKFRKQIRKIIEIAATRCHILTLKCTSSISTPLGAYSAPPDPLAAGF